MEWAALAPLIQTLGRSRQVRARIVVHTACDLAAFAARWRAVCRSCAPARSPRRCLLKDGRTLEGRYAEIASVAENPLVAEGTGRRSAADAAHW